MATVGPVDAAIVTRGLTKVWGDVRAVDDLDLVVQPDECYAFLGRNGSGESTTARMLFDFIRPTGGSAAVLGGLGSDTAVRSMRGQWPVGPSCQEWNVRLRVSSTIGHVTPSSAAASSIFGTSASEENSGARMPTISNP